MRLSPGGRTEASPRRAGASGALRTLGALVPLAVFLVAATPVAFRRAAAFLRESRLAARETLVETRRRVFGDYAEGIARIERAVGPDESYLLAARDASGVYAFVVYDLAPRRAFYFGGWDRSPAALRARGRAPANVRWVVVTNGMREAPDLYEAEAFFRGAGE